MRNGKSIMTNITAGSEISTDGIAFEAAAYIGGRAGACGWPDPPLTPNAMLSTSQLPSKTLGWKGSLLCLPSQTPAHCTPHSR